MEYNFPRFMGKSIRSEGEFHHNILKLNTIDSTNSFAKAHFDELIDRTAVVADYQTAGRGRAGRSWCSLEGNLFLTLILKPNIPFSQESAHATMTHYMGVSLCLLLEKMGLRPGLKWPNDILVDGKKIAGILAEFVPVASKSSRSRMGIVIGIGVNLNMKDSDLEAIDQPAVSLAQLLPPKRRLDRDHFLTAYLDTFFEEYDLFLRNGFTQIARTYDSFLLYKGEKIRLQTEQNTRRGILKGISPGGALLLEEENGQQNEYYAGDVWLE